ncbi:MAG TPA: hypothetical protein VEK79_16840 [Thermoanaerobaculia bacterium]|nr:hypothetical protein [Thermoanaerobaculia bacterium]
MIGVLLFVLVGLAVPRANVWLAGTGVTGIVLFVAMVWHVPMFWAVIALAIAAGALASRRLARRRPAAESGNGTETLPSQPARTPALHLPDVFIALAIAFLLFTSTILPLSDYDGRAFWMLKAKAIAHEQAIDGPFFQGRTAATPRNEYPLLMPLDAAVVLTLAGDLDDRHTRWFFAFFAVAFALELRRRLGGWIAATFLWLPQILIDPSGALSAYVDIALGAFVACAFFELIENGAPIRFGFWVACVALTKNEGLPLALLLLVAGAFVFRKRIAIALVLPVIAIAHLVIWRARIERSDEENFARTMLDVPSHIERFAGSIGRLFANVISLEDWGLVMILIATAWIFARRGHALAAIVIVPMLVLYATAVAVSPWNLDTMRGLAPRVLTHLLGPLFFVLAERPVADVGIVWPALRLGRSTRPPSANR